MGRNMATRAGIMLAMALLAASAASRLGAEEGPAGGQDFALIERGRYLATAADCGACHNDPEGGRPFAGGRAIETPFGRLVAPNITPDLETGIGTWSEADFEAAVRRGKLPGGQLLYPAMPFVYYRKMSRDDVRAIRAYLATVAPAHHAVKSDQLPFPFSIRTSMHFWDSLYFRDAPFKSDAKKSAAWNRGAYLVEGPAHCGACHTPKTSLGGDDPDQYLQGYGLQGWFAPDITNDKQRGIGLWTAEDVVSYLKTGHNRFDAASGPMGEVVSRSTSKMSDADLDDIAAYLKDQPGRSRNAAPLPANDPLMQAGAAIYRDQCSACHKLDGTGVPKLIPDLTRSAAVAAQDPTTLLQVVLHGAQSVATPQEPTGPAMPAYGKQLSDAEVAAIATYLRNSWGHAAPALSESDVSAARSRLSTRTE